MSLPRYILIGGELRPVGGGIAEDLWLFMTDPAQLSEAERVAVVDEHWEEIKVMPGPLGGAVAHIKSIDAILSSAARYSEIVADAEMLRGVLRTPAGRTSLIKHPDARTLFWSHQNGGWFWATGAPGGPEGSSPISWSRGGGTGGEFRAWPDETTGQPPISLRYTIFRLNGWAPDYIWAAPIDFTDIATLKVETRVVLGGTPTMRININGSLLFSTNNEDLWWTDRTLDVTSYTGVKMLECSFVPATVNSEDKSRWWRNLVLESV